MRGARTPLLGGRTPAWFLSAFWQKRALLVRGALAGFEGFLGRDELCALALRDDVESRLVLHERGRWEVTEGPFRRRDFAALPPRRWTLLVHGVNLHDARADALLRRFDFVPYARLDDLMVSYAAPGGGVGPHFDSYDVFLLQGFGRRRWRYGAQRDLSLAPRAKLRILSRFAPSHDECLAPGDMLYLPPHVAHDGVAIDACTTYSIGFRAGSADEIAAAFLDYLRDRLALEGRYRDPWLSPAVEPARIDARLARGYLRMLDRVRWDRKLAARFLGTWLSEPKPSVTFKPPRPPLSIAAFRRRSARRGIVLDLGTRLLYDGQALYVNGTACDWPSGDAQAIRALANARRLAPAACTSLGAPGARLIHEWYRDGYLRIEP